MDLRGLVFLIIGVSSGLCGSIDFRKAAEIFRNLSRNYSNDFESRSLFSDPVVRFINFMRDHGRVYATEEELFDRHENFVANVETVEDMQFMDEGTARFNINKFSDFSDEELQNLTGLNIESSDPFDSLKLTDPFGSLKETDPFDSLIENLTDKADAEKKAIEWMIDARKLPKSLDWRDKGYVSRVKTQGNCGGCWTFSTVGLVESMNAIRTHKLVELSEQQLIDCDKSNMGCYGGRMDNALKYIINNGGLEKETDYPYVQRENEGCKATLNDGRDRVQVKSFKRIRTGERAMQKWLAQHGPLSVGINAMPILYYSDGIINFNKKVCDPEAQNHAVLIVGFGEEKRGRKTLPYWIVKNSWGSDWGEKGYFRIKRGSNMCGISVFVHGAITK